MVHLSDKSVLEFRLDFSAQNVAVIQKGEVGIETGKIVIPMEDLKNWGAKLKGLTSIFPLDFGK